MDERVTSLEVIEQEDFKMIRSFYEYFNERIERVDLQLNLEHVVVFLIEVYLLFKQMLSQKIGEFFLKLSLFQQKNPANYLFEHYSFGEKKQELFEKQKKLTKELQYVKGKGGNNR